MSADLFITHGWAMALAALIGLIVGSTLNVVIHRLPRMLERHWQEDAALLRGEPIPKADRLNLFVPPSHCPACQHRLGVAELIPLASWLWLRGRCSACASPIALRYPLVEAAAAALFSLCVWRFGATVTSVAAMLLCAMLLAAAVIDLETHLLPDALTLPLIWSGLLVALGDGLVSLPDAVLGATAGYLSLWTIHHGFRLVTGREGMGYGDFKLFAALGAWLGWAMLPAVLLIAAASAALTTLGAAAIGRHDLRAPLAFGPWLAAAGLLALFSGPSWPTLAP